MSSSPPPQIEGSADFGAIIAPGRGASKREEPQGEATNVKVMVRVRLFNRKELDISAQAGEAKPQPCVRMRGKTCAILEYVKDDKGFTHEKEREAFDFDDCFWSLPEQQGYSELPYATQLDVYRKSGLLAMRAALDGFNTCIFAYGQTGSGKTYSMLGSPEDPGISPRLCDDLFATIENLRKTQPTTKITVECMFFEIYNEDVRDLFNKKSKAGQYNPVKIRQHPTKGVYVDGLLRKEVGKSEEAKMLIENGTLQRATAETKMNLHSSRSHAIFQIQISQMDALKGTQRVSSINLVDLAGSEKVKKSEVVGAAFTEAAAINQSLSTLRRVIDTLIENSTTKKQRLPPFRESVLTYVLSDSLGGNSKTQMLATISPHVFNLEDTVGTLRYALRAKAIVCNAKVNEEKSAAMVDAMRNEIMELRMRLKNPGAGDGDGNGPLVAGPPSAEILNEIALREEELKRMQDDETRMKEMLEEYRKKETQLNERLAAIGEQQQQLTVAVEAQKRDRFASAFRSAFLISGEKRKIASNVTVLEEARKERDAARAHVHQLTEDVAAAGFELAKNEAARAALEEALAAFKARAAEDEARLKRQNAELAAENAAGSRRIDEGNVRLEVAKSARAEAEGRLTRLQQDMLALTHTVEREQLEKAKVGEALEASSEAYAAQLDALRRRKEKYKALHVEEAIRVGALRGAIDSTRDDRSALVESLKAQQRLLEQKDFLVDALTTQLDEERAKSATLAALAERRSAEADGLAAALREYESASLRWMGEHTLMEREIARLRAVSDGPFRAVDAIAAAHSGPSLLRRSASPVRPASASVALALTPGAGASSPNGGLLLAARPASPRAFVAPVPAVRATQSSTASMLTHFVPQPKVERVRSGDHTLHVSPLGAPRPRWNSPARGVAR